MLFSQQDGQGGMHMLQAIFFNITSQKPSFGKSWVTKVILSANKHPGV